MKIKIKIQLKTLSHTFVIILYEEKQIKNR